MTATADQSIDITDSHLTATVTEIAIAHVHTTAITHTTDTTHEIAVIVIHATVLTEDIAQADTTMEDLDFV